MALDPDLPDFPETLSPDDAMTIAAGLARAHRRLPIVFWTHHDWRVMWGVTGERLDPGHVELRLRCLGHGTIE